MKPSLLCRIIGHRWYIKERTYEKHPTLPRVTLVNTTFRPLTHCMRCGTTAPAFSLQ